MDVVRELPAAVGVPQEISYDGDDGAEDLDRDVPTRADYAEDHAGGEDDAEGEDLD